MYSLNEIKNLVQFFIRSAIKFPDRPAIHIDETIISYDQLYERAACLASYLSNLAGEHCAVLSAHGIDSYVGLIATLMSGKVYVPLSVKSPGQRNLQMLKFSKSTILIVDAKCVQEAICLLKNIDIDLHVIFPSVSQLPNEIRALKHKLVSSLLLKNIEPLMNISLNDYAYLLFTSGSTGTPKAIMTTHASIIEYIDKMNQYFKPHEYDRFSQFIDLSFDVAMHEIFLCWNCGACLFSISDQMLPSIQQFIIENKLSFWTSVPSLASLLKQTNRLQPGIFPSIRHSMFIGEPLLEELVCSWHEAASNSAIHNFYGPTEATIAITIYQWDQSTAHASGYVPIGRPLEGQDIVILDDEFKLVPSGCDGELYLSGTQVAREYWNNPNITKEKFLIIDSISRNKLWYKTGDFVCWDESYGLIFKGRDIDCLKVRGGRVDRLEVELVLRDIAKTDTVAIVPARPINDGLVSGIVAFIGYSVIDNFTIIKICRSRLPDYMVPAEIIRVESLPLNKNGKVDYQLLKQAVS